MEDPEPIVGVDQVKFCCHSCGNLEWEVSLVTLRNGKRILILECNLCNGYTYIESLEALPPGAVVHGTKERPN